MPNGQPNTSKKNRSLERILAYRDITLSSDGVYEEVERLVDVGVTVFLMAAVPGLIVASLRILEFGLHVGTVVQALVCVIALASLFLRRRIGLRVSARIWIVSVIIYGYAGLFEWGLSGQGMLIIMFGGYLAVLLGTWRQAVVVTVFSGIVATAAGVCFVLGWTTFDFDVAAYAVSPLAWSTALLTLVGLMAFITAIVWLLKSSWLEATDALLESEKRYRTLFEQSQDAINVVSSKARFAEFNRAFLELVGYSATELSPMDERVLWADSLQRARWDEHLKQGTAIRNYEWKLRRKDGQVREIVMNSVPYVSAEGMTYYQSILRDVTEQKLAQENLSVSEERLRLAWETIPDYASISRLEDALMVDVNGGFTRMTGYEREETLGRSALDFGLWANPDDRLLMVAGLKQDGYVHGLQTKFRRKDREIRTVEISAGLMTLDGAPHLFAIVKDIEDLKRAREEQERTAAMFRNYFELSHAGMAITSPEKAWVAVNDRLCDLLGYSREELLGKAWDELTYPEDVEPDIEQFKRMLAGRIDNYSLEKRFRRKDGSTIHTLMTVSVSRQPEGAPTYILAQVVDITERKRIELALQQSEEKYRAMFQAMQGSVAVYEAAEGGKDFIFKDFNASAERWCHLGKDEVVGKSLLSVFPNLADTDLLGALQRVHHTGEPENLPAFYYEDDRRKGWQENSIYRLPSGQVVAISNDVTDRRNAEEIHRKRTAELEAISRLGQTAMSSLSLDENASQGLSELARVVDCDLAMLFLREEDSLVIHSCFPNQPDFADGRIPMHAVGECLCGIAVQRNENVFSPDITEDPRCTWEECKRAGFRSAAAVPLKTGQETLGVIALCSYRRRDFSTQEHLINSLVHLITMGIKNALLFEQIEQHALELEQRVAELKRSDEEREELQKQLLHSQKMEAIGRLAGGIAHDFNNLLTAMTGYTDLLMGQFKEKGPQAEKLVQIGRAADRAAALTRQLLAFSRSQVLSVRTIDINAVVRDMEEMLSRLLDENIELVVETGNSPATIKGDKSQLEQVVMNLVVNARDAMAEGGRLTIEISSTYLDEIEDDPYSGLKPGRYVKITVDDTGIGMDDETQKRIFDPFFTTKQKGVGTGLGLSTVYGIVQQHGGQLSVSSEPGRGATFTVFFPESQEPAAISPEAPTLPVQAYGESTILVVEDDATVRNFACEVLDNLGYRILQAQDPDEAFALSEGHLGIIDLLLTDVILPKMDGKSMFEQLVVKRPEMKVLYMSGYTDDLIVRRGVLESDVHFLPKPFNVAALSRKVSEALGGPLQATTETHVVPAREDAGLSHQEMLRRIEDLPENLRELLLRSAEEANRSTAAKVLDLIGERDEALAQALRALLKRFRFDLIIEFSNRQGRSV